MRFKVIWSDGKVEIYEYTCRQFGREELNRIKADAENKVGFGGHLIKEIYTINKDGSERIVWCA